MWKLIKTRPQPRLESGGPVGGALRSYCSSPITLNRKRLALHLQQEDFSTLLPQQEEKKCSTPLATAHIMRDCHNSANEKSLHLKLPVSYSELFVYNSSSQLAISCIKDHCSSLFSRLACGSATVWMSWITILCYPWINPFVLIK